MADLQSRRACAAARRAVSRNRRLLRRHRNGQPVAGSPGGAGTGGAAYRETLRLAEIGASDAHFLAAAGSGITHFTGRTPEDLRRAILDRSTAAESFHVPLSAIGYGALVKQQVRSLVMLPARNVAKPLRRLFGGGRVTAAPPGSAASTAPAETGGPS